MKVTKIIANCGIAITTCLLAASCVKELGKEVAFEDDTFNNKALVQVYNGTVNAARNYVYVDAKPVNGASLAYGATFPSTPANFALTAGFREFLIRDTSGTATQTPMSFAQNFQPNGYYTIFMYDTINAAKQKTVQNDIQVPADTTSRLRFANFVYHPSLGAVPAVDIFSKKRGANVFSNVKFTDVTGFIPYASSSTDTFYVRIAGTTTNLQNYTPPVGTTAGFYSDIISILNPVRNRSYTLIFRGGYRSAVTTIATVRVLSVFANN